MRSFLAALLVALIPGISVSQEKSPTPAQLEHFEKKIRPLLLANCMECHGANEKKIRGKLWLTTREKLLEGGESGPAIVPGKPEESLLVKVLSHRDEMKMPPKGRLPDAEIALLTEWVKAGAFWPAAPTAVVITPRKEGPLFTQEQKEFWAFQPLRKQAIPTIRGAAKTPIDAFLLAKLEAAGLTPAKPAEKRTLLRRVTFDLTGLPPTPEELDAFLADTSPNAFEKVVDRLLASPAYGERWGRHWLDIVRYADTNGLDENTAFANAWRYRDYVISALNRDKPYDEFLREQIAGDLLPASTDPQTMADRLTALGMMVVGPKVLAEPDKQKMLLDIADEQLDTLGKGILGLTLGCARCHDHKFDPIPTRDYYSLLSIFTSTRTMVNLNTVAQVLERKIPDGETPAEAASRNQKLQALTNEINAVEAELRKKFLDDARSRLADYLLASAEVDPAKSLQSRLALLDPKAKIPGIVMIEAESFRTGNVIVRKEGFGEGIGIIDSTGVKDPFAEYVFNVPTDGEYQLEVRYASLESRPAKILLGGKPLFDNVLKGNTWGWRAANQTWEAVGTFKPGRATITLRITSTGNLPLIEKFALVPVETAPAATARPKTGTLREVATAKKLVPEFLHSLRESLKPKKPDDLVFGPWVELASLPDEQIEKAAAALLVKVKENKQKVAPILLKQLEAKPLKTLADVASAYSRAAATAAQATKQTDASTAQLRDWFGGAAGVFRLGSSLPLWSEGSASDLAKVASKQSEMAKLLAAAKPAITVLAVSEGTKEGGYDTHPRNLFVQIRGNYVSPGEEAPAGFLRILTGEKVAPFLPTKPETVTKPEANKTRFGAERPASGRLELAKWLTSPANPLTARVLVNRVWQHHFGEGIVRSPDNFGKLGERPTHPELLDYLASTFIENGWSLKKLHRMILLSAAWQSSSEYRPEVAARDPENRLLAHFIRRRLDAEPIRDAILAVSGQLDPKLGGSLMPTGNFAYSGINGASPIYETPRRSIYLPVVRNSVYDFFQTFDFVEPSVMNGKRASTVVAPQALFLMNSPFVQKSAGAFADTLLKIPEEEARIRMAYRRAYAREATTPEVEQGKDFVKNYALALTMKEPDAMKRNRLAWAGWCQVLFAGSEFMYLE